MIRLWSIITLGSLLLSATIRAQDSDIFEFFETEAKSVQVVTMSRLPLSTRRAPATVYVITSKDLEAMGAQTLWDALRRVPGVDVMTTRTFYGEVSIRGLNRALSNRALVLLDGRTVLNGLFDSVYWEGLSIPFSQIDRIEIVEGPASALYGANAISGVINIISKTPEQINGGIVRYAVGEYRTHLAEAVFGQREGKVAFAGGGSIRTSNQFENSDLRASEVGGFHGMLTYDLSGKSQVGVSAGMSNHDTQFSTGGGGTGFIDGTTGFLRADYHYAKTRMRIFWNRSRPVLREFAVAQDPFIHTDQWDALAEHGFSLGSQWDLVSGGNFRRIRLRSNTYDTQRIVHDQGALFLEAAWRASDVWTLIGSGRLDWFDQSGLVGSPRGSLVFSPSPAHVFRFSVGRAFRDPTLTERHLRFTPQFNTPLNIPAELAVLGDQNLDQERMTLFELAHTGQFGSVSVQSVGFYYRLHDVIVSGPLQLVPEALPLIQVQTRFLNSAQTVRAWGGEVTGELKLGTHAQFFATYSHQHIRGVDDLQAAHNGGPRHKINGGFRLQKESLMIDLQVYWVDKTVWSDVDLRTFQLAEGMLSDYVLTHVNVGYTFPGSRLRLNASIFNVANNAHFEMLVGTEISQGLNAEVVKRRATVGFVYSF